MALLAPLLLQCRQNESRASSEPPAIEIRAAVRPAHSVTIAAQIDGRVEGILAAEGARLTAGSTIVQLSNPSVERDQEVSRAQLEWLEERLRRAGRSPSGAAESSSTLEISARILALRKQRLDKARALRQTNDITARDLEQAEVEYLSSLRDYRNQRSPDSGGAADTALLRIELRKTAADQKFAAERLALLQIQSPIDGVMTRLHVTEGQVVFPRDPVAEVTDVTTLEVRGNVAPELLRYIRPGMRVEVRVLSVPPRTFADEIEYVIPVQGSGESRGATVVVRIPNPDGSLQPNTEALITLRSLE